MTRHHSDPLLPSLVIDNETHWRTDDLRKFFLAGLKAKGADITRKTIHVKYAKKNNINGYALLPVNGREGRSITMHVPRDNIPMLMFAQVFEHEVDHTLGLTHREMAHWPDLKPMWHKRFQIRKRKEPASPEKPKMTNVERREAMARGKVRSYKTRLEELEKVKKRYRYLLQKWERKVRYYDKKKAASPQG